MSELHADLTSLAYLVAAVLFIMALRGLSSPESSRAGNYFGMLGMFIAVVTTALSPEVESYGWILAALAIGAVVGVVIARRSEERRGGKGCGCRWWRGHEEREEGRQTMGCGRCGGGQW